MKLLFLHFRTLTMNFCRGELRWQRFTGVSFGTLLVGAIRDCRIDNRAGLAEYDRTWGKSVIIDESNQGTL